MKKHIGIILMLSLILSAVSSAAMISYNTSYTGVGAVSPSSVIGQLQKFDSSLGTLTYVSLTLNSTTYAGTLTWDNESAVVTDVELKIGAEVTASTLGGLLVTIATPLQAGSQSAVGADDDASPDFVGSDSFTLSGNTGNDIQTNGSSSASVLTAFTASGTEYFDVYLGSILKKTVSTTGGYGAEQYTAGVTDGTVTVCYTYTVPEPATIAMLGIGCLGLIKRRKAAK